MDSSVRVLPSPPHTRVHTHGKGPAPVQATVTEIALMLQSTSGPRPESVAMEFQTPTTAEVLELCRALRANTTLTYLSLSHSVLGTNWEHVWAAIASSPSILHLNVEGCELTPELTMPLCRVLENTSAGADAGSQLQTIDFNDNKLGDAGAKALAIALCKNDTLYALDLQNNAISEAAAYALSLALEKQNKTLVHLDLRYNHIPTQGAVALAAALVSNETMRSVRLEHNFVKNASLLRAIESKCSANYQRAKARLSYRKCR